MLSCAASHTWRVPTLTKSLYTAALQCPKLLWWKVHEPNAVELQPDKVLQDRFDQGDFLLRNGERTLGQAALQFVLAEPSIASALPNIYEERQIDELAKAPDTPPLIEEELARIHDLYDNDFYLDREPAPA